MALPGDIFKAEPLFLGQAGFAHFGPAHLAWIAACIALIAVLVSRYRRLPAGQEAGSPRRRMLLAVALAPIALLASDDALMVAAGVFWPGYWPLHFCNFAEYFCLWHALRPNGANRELAFAFGCSGGCMALLFANWSYCPWYAWPTVCGFLEHSFIFAFALMAESDPRASSRWRDMAFSAAFVALYVPFFRWFNPAHDTNFGFVTYPAAGSPLEAWANALGNPGYLVPYAAVFCAVLVALHGCLALQRKIARARGVM